MSLQGFQSYPAVVSSTLGNEWGLVTRPIGAGTSGSFPVTGTVIGEFFDPVPVKLTGAMSYFDPGNSSTTPLAANAAFTGSWFDCTDFASLSYMIQTDVTSSSGGVQRQWSEDAINPVSWVNDDLSSDRTGAGNGTDLTTRIHARFFRLIYQNGTGAQSFFRLQTFFGKYLPTGDTVGVAHNIADGDDALITKSVLSGKVKRSQDGNNKTYADVNVDAAGALQVSQAGTQGAFGSMLSVNETIKANLSFPYTIQTRLVNTGTVNGGTVTWDTGRAKLQTSANTAGSATLESKRAVQYTPGQGIIARFTTVYNSGAVGSTQECGIGDINDGFFFGFSGSQFGVCRRRGGVDTWTSQSAWNGDDQFLGSGFTGVTLDTTKGYPYQIQYQWLGYGAIKYFVENPKSGQFVLVHTDRYAGTDTLTSIFNPTLPLHARVANNGNTGNIILYTPSMGVLTEGDTFNPGSNVRNTFNAAITGAPTTGKQCFTLKSKATNIFGGTNTNRITTHIDHIGIRAASVKDLFVTMYLNATVTTPTYTDVSTNTSVIQTDVAGTADGTGGIALMTWPVAGGASFVQDLTEYGIQLRPGDTLSFVVFAEASTVDGRVTVGWHEEN